MENGLTLLILSEAELKQMKKRRINDLKKLINKDLMESIDNDCFNYAIDFELNAIESYLKDLQQIQERLELFEEV